MKTTKTMPQPDVTNNGEHEPTEHDQIKGIAREWAQGIGDSTREGLRKNLWEQTGESAFDSSTHKDVLTLKLQDVAIDVIERDILPPDREDTFRGELLKFITPVESKEDFDADDLRSIVRGYVERAGEVLPPSASEEDVKHHREAVTLRNVATKIVELYEKKHKNIDSIALRKNIGLLPPDILTPAPVQSSQTSETTTPPAAPSAEQQQSQTGEQQAQAQPGKPEDVIVQNNGVPTRIEDALQQTQQELDEAIKRGDKEAVDKMLGKAKDWRKISGDSKLLNGLILTIMITATLYVGGLWLATRYRGGGGGRG